VGLRHGCGMEWTRRARARARAHALRAIYLLTLFCCQRCFVRVACVSVRAPAVVVSTPLDWYWHSPPPNCVTTATVVLLVVVHGHPPRASVCARSSGIISSNKCEWLGPLRRRQFVSPGNRWRLRLIVPTTKTVATANSDDGDVDGVACVLQAAALAAFQNSA
jgi:hypothetical protein